MRLTPVFLLSATDAAHFPSAAKTFGAPEIAFLGRSNVGKSSLINALLGSKQAHTSSTPGRTRAINFFALHEGAGDRIKPRPTLIFADLPGYGYAKISRSISAEWPTFIEPYLAERETLALAVCLVDSNIPPQPSDRQLIDFFRHTQRPFLRPPLQQRPRQVARRLEARAPDRRGPPRLRQIRSRNQSPLAPHHGCGRVASQSTG
jgi:GTP-binding protein